MKRWVPQKYWIGDNNVSYQMERMPQKYWIGVNDVSFQMEWMLCKPLFMNSCCLGRFAKVEPYLEKYMFVFMEIM